MSYTKRFLILNRTNVAMVPRAEGFETDAVKSANSPSLLTPDAAKAFGAHLAAKYPGKSFYLVEVLSGVKSGGSACWGDATVDADANE